MLPRERVRALILMALRSIVAWVLVLGCAGTPPDPPDIARMELTPVTPIDGEHVLILGTRESAEPGAGVIAVDLDRAHDLTRGMVAADGSFLVEVPGGEGDVMRVQLEVDGLRSDAIDMVAGFGAAVAPERAIACVHVPTEIDLARERDLVIENECEEPIVVDAIALRRPAELDVEAALPAAIGAGETLRVTLAPRGAVDEILFVHLTDPALDRRAVSVFAR